MRRHTPRRRRQGPASGGRHTSAPATLTRTCWRRRYRRRQRRGTDDGFSTKSHCLDTGRYASIFKVYISEKEEEMSRFLHNFTTESM